MNKLTIGLLAMMLPASLLAQAVPEELEVDAEIRRYTVEVIIFRYAEDIALGTEVFLPDKTEVPDEGDVGELLGEVDETEPEPLAAATPDASAELIDDESEPLPDIELVLLEEEDYQLVDAFEQLDRLEAYEPLMHFGWTQATWPEDQTDPISLHLFARPPEELDGTLTLYLSRYLHLVVDLQLRAAEEIDDRMIIVSGVDSVITELGYEETPPRPPVYFRIQENRILRNGELRYFDHPKFGLLAQVTRVEEEETPEDGELLGYPIQ